MWIMSAAALPGYLPSVARGLRSNSAAPASAATARTSADLPVRGAPYSSTARTAGALARARRPPSELCHDRMRALCSSACMPLTAPWATALLLLRCGCAQQFPRRATRARRCGAPGRDGGAEQRQRTELGERAAQLLRRGARVGARARQRAAREMAAAEVAAERRAGRHPRDQAGAGELREQRLHAALGLGAARTAHLQLGAPGCVA